MRTIAEKHILGGREVIAVRDRRAGITPYRRSARWIVWSVDNQTVISEHSTKIAAVKAYNLYE